MQDDNGTQEMVAQVADALNWTEAEARNFIEAIVSESPDRLLDAVCEAITIANEVENRAAIIGLMKQMGPALQCRVNGGGLTIRLAPGCEVHQDAAGIRVTSPAMAEG